VPGILGLSKLNPNSAIAKRNYFSYLHSNA
jgi:hypothetical protein